MQGIRQTDLQTFVNRKAYLSINSETIRSRFTQLRCEVTVVTVAESAPTTDYTCVKNNLYWTGKYYNQRRIQSTYYFYLSTETVSLCNENLSGKLYSCVIYFSLQTLFFRAHQSFAIFSTLKKIIKQIAIVFYLISINGPRVDSCLGNF